MIKGILIGGIGPKALSYLDKLTVPIIENTPHERDLKESMADAMRKWPDAAAVLVRRHGVYVWGADWEKAKTQTEVRGAFFSRFFPHPLCAFSPFRLFAFPLW